jgi:hypothetical protein
MALTLEQLSDLVKTLQTKVGNLETEIKRYRQDICELEDQLSRSITTQKLVVQNDAQIVERNVLTDGQMLDAHEDRLNTHDGILGTHQSILNTSVLGQFLSQVTYRVRHDGYKFFSFPNIEAWDIFAPIQK